MDYILSAQKSLFPTPVGVFLRQSGRIPSCHSLPHARGGVSVTLTCPFDLALSSPRPWGCFHPFRVHSAKSKLFPTPVGMFPRMKISAEKLITLPHARGGVSPRSSSFISLFFSSLRPWGCFPGNGYALRGNPLFPTPVGVFLSQMMTGNTATALPHARGGVSLFQKTRDVLRISSPHPWGCFRKGRERTALNSDRTEEESAAMAASSRRTSAFSDQC